MKKLLFIACMLFAGFGNINAQTTWKGNTIVATSTTTSKGSKAEKTPFTFQAKDGKTYPIYISAKGSCYIVRISGKTGKEYKQYLGKEVSTEICGKLHREYKGK